MRELGLRRVGVIVWRIGGSSCICFAECACRHNDGWQLGRIDVERGFAD